MQIPETFFPFPKSVVIAVTDSTQAKLYFADDRLFEPLETISSDYPPKENEERYSMKTPSGTHSAEQHELTKQLSRDKLYRLLNEKLMTYLEKEKMEALVICAPEEHMETLRESLNMKLYKRTEVWISKLLINEDPIDLIAIIQELG